MSLYWISEIFNITNKVPPDNKNKYDNQKGCRGLFELASMYFNKLHWVYIRAKHELWSKQHIQFKIPFCLLLKLVFFI